LQCLQIIIELHIILNLLLQLRVCDTIIIIWKLAICGRVALILKVADYITLKIFFKFKLNRLLVTNHKGLAMAQAVSRRLHTTEA
jgi:hypothetical protein